MNKADLEKEADEYADKHAFRVPYDGSNKFYDDVDFKASKEGYLAGAEPREKRIAELEEQNTSLLTSVENLNKSVQELEAQIEEMKSDVKGNIKWADQKKNDQMYCKLNAMFNQWEIKEK